MNMCSFIKQMKPVVKFQIIALNYILDDVQNLSNNKGAYYSKRNFSFGHANEQCSYVIIDMSVLSQTLIFLFVFLASASLCSSVLWNFLPICAFTNIFSQNTLVTRSCCGASSNNSDFQSFFLFCNMDYYSIFKFY